MAWSERVQREGKTNHLRSGQREQIILWRDARPSFPAPSIHPGQACPLREGGILDVAVDIRKGSPTYGKHIECLLCAHDEEEERIAKQFEGHDFNGQWSMFNVQLSIGPSILHP